MTARLAVLLAGLLASLIIAASCGGGGADQDAGKGQRVTDPARVPSSTPIRESGVLYQIRNDGRVDSSGGDSSTLPSGTPSPTAAKSYVVKSGDTCGAIASQFGITVDELKRANRTIDDGCANLHAGESLKIPGTTPTPGAGTTSGPTVRPSGKTYTVAGGDTCDAIARSFGVKVGDLIALNALDSDCRTLKIGAVLKIP